MLTSNSSPSIANSWAARLGRHGLAMAGIAFSLLAGATIEAGAAGGCFSVPYICQSPGDIDPATPRTYPDLSRAYADMAWKDFLALNSPAAMDENGNPLPRASNQHRLDYNNGEYIAVWQVFAEARDIFQPDGSAPGAFGGPHDLPEACSALDARGPHLLLHRTSKAAAKPPSAASKRAEGTAEDDVLDEYVQALRMGPVIDRNGRYVRFGLHFNKAMYDYILQNRLFNAEGQANFQGGDPVAANGPDWPRGAFGGKVGSIFLKSAWKVLGEGDDPSQFYRTQAYIYDKAGGPFGDTPLADEQCTIETVGLVGFHIVHRTNTAPQWVWSTFEHAANAPWLHNFSVNRPIEDVYSFFDPEHCPRTDGMPSCAYNTVPPHPWRPENAPGGSGQTPSQVVRVAPPGRYAIAANEEMRDQLRQFFGETVWENYFLVDVQFSTKVNWDSGNGIATVNPAYPAGAPEPAFLANSVLETYIQGFGPGSRTTNGNSVPDDDQMISWPDSGPRVDPFSLNGPHNLPGGARRVTSSCMGCHADAAMATGVTANFVFSLSRARPVAKTEPKTPQ